jgi:hypothetical protein
LSVTSIDFGLIKNGSFKDTILTAAIKNIGDEDLTITSAAVSGTNASEFSLPDEISNLTIEKNATANLRVRFSPASGGEKSAQIDFTSNSPVNPSILLEGTGGFVSIQSSVSILDFGSVGVGVQKDSILGLQNTGNMAGTITAMTITGAQASSFQVVAPTPPSVIGAGQAQIATIRFIPLTGGLSEADLNITLQDVAQPVAVRLRGNGITGITEPEPPLPLNLRAYPNPSKDNIILSFEPDNSDSYEISVIDVFGTTVRNFHLAAGETYQIKWDGRDSLGNELPSGIYVVLLKSGQASASVPVSIAR